MWGSEVLMAGKLARYDIILGRIGHSALAFKPEH
jgi:hypothetical protein